MKLIFVQARGQNSFFDELVAAIRDELDQLGVESSVAVGEFPAADERSVYVLLPPHEYFALTPNRAQPTPAHLEQTIFICAEQPGSAFWEENARLIDRTRSPVFDINRDSAARLSHGVGRTVEHFQLGWTRSWARSDPRAESSEAYAFERDIDLLYMGTRSAHRDRVLARCARSLHGRECRIVLGDNRAPLTEANPEWLGSSEKWRALGRSKLLLNVHRDEVPYFEWLRVVQSISNGVVVLSECSLGDDPLLAGEHYFASVAEALGVTADSLLERPELLHETACRAYEFLQEELPLRRAVEQLVERAEGMVGRSARELPAIPPLDGRELTTAQSRPAAHVHRRIESAASDRLTSIEANLGRVAREQALELKALRGELTRLHHLVGAGSELPQVELIATSPAYRGAQPAVSVITPLYNYEREITEALGSAAMSTERAIELVIVDDGSRDQSRAAAQSWIAAHPQIPALLLAHPTNRGLGQARNTAVDAARGEFVFALDADNSVYPGGIEKLRSALHRDPQASLAWGYIERHDGLGDSVGILSAHEWEPERFRDGNFIDAMALWRRSDMLRLGGYTTDAELYGWEDFELLLRLAESGGHGLLVPEFVARYRVAAGSMLATANLAEIAMLQKLTEMYPKTMGAELVGAT